MDNNQKENQELLENIKLDFMKEPENEPMPAKEPIVEQAASPMEDLIRKLAESGEATARQLNKVNENLHKENQELKKGLYDSLTLPVLKDVVEAGNNIVMDINRYRKQGNDLAVEALEGAVDYIHIVLERHNVEPYQPQVGDAYEPITQKVLKTVETAQEQKDRTVAEVRGFGYRFVKEGSSMVISPCKVNVYTFNKKPEQQKEEE